MNISIIIPAYNEEKRLPKTLSKLKKFLSKKNVNYEIIVVDDGSKDNTVNIAKKFDVIVLKHEKNKGKGAAVKTGLLNANNEIVGFIDADGSTDLESMIKLCEKINGNDMVIGSRRTVKSKIEKKQSIFRRFFSQVFNIYVNVLFGLNIKDTQCGCKFMKNEVGKVLAKETKSDGFEFDVEFLVRAKLNKYKILEFPVTWRHVEGSRFNIYKSINMFIYLLKLKISLW